MNIFSFSVGSEAKRVAVRCVFAIGVVCWANFFSLIDFQVFVLTWLELRISMNIQGQASGLKRQELFLIVKIPPFSHGHGTLVTSDVDLNTSLQPRQLDKP